MARNLRMQMEELRRPNDTKAAKKKKPESDFSSNRGSEDRQVTSTTGRGQKRGRDFEIEKVCVFPSLLVVPALSFATKLHQRLLPKKPHICSRNILPMLRLFA